MTIIDLLFPKTCLSCKKPGGYICFLCAAKVKSPKPTCCVCERPSVDFMTHVRCKRPLSLDAAVSVFAYQGVIRKSIVKLKYSFAKEIAEELANHAISKIRKEKIILPKKVILIPIPLYWLRKNWRGFNQVEEIGKLIAKNLNWDYNSDILLRKSHRRPQTELRGDKRKENIRGVFSFNKDERSIVKSQMSIVLFDDVSTTGSTLKEAGKVLKRNGMKNVWALTLAH